MSVCRVNWKIHTNIIDHESETNTMMGYTALINRSLNGSLPMQMYKPLWSWSIRSMSKPSTSSESSWFFESRREMFSSDFNSAFPPSFSYRCRGEEKLVERKNRILSNENENIPVDRRWTKFRFDEHDTLRALTIEMKFRFVRRSLRTEKRLFCFSLIFHKKICQKTFFLESDGNRGFSLIVVSISLIIDDDRTWPTDERACCCWGQPEINRSIVFLQIVAHYSEQTKHFRRNRSKAIVTVRSTLNFREWSFRFRSSTAEESFRLSIDKQKCKFVRVRFRFRPDSEKFRETTTTTVLKLDKAHFLFPLSIFFKRQKIFGCFNDFPIDLIVFSIELDQKMLRCFLFVRTSIWDATTEFEAPDLIFFTLNSRNLAVGRAEKCRSVWLDNFARI